MHILEPSGVIASPSATIQPLLVTFDEAAKLLSYDVSVIHRLVREGQLERVGSGRGSRVVYASIERWVKANTRA